MKKVRRKFLILLCCSLFYFTSCVYDTDKVFDNATSQLPESEIRSLTPDFAGDSLFLYYDSYFNYNFECSNRQILKVEFLLDNNSYCEFKDKSGVLVMDNYADNTAHKLTVRIYTKSTSGSIMDQMNQEWNVYTKEYTLFMSSLVGKKLKAYYSNGFLTMESDPYRNPNLKQYKLFKVINGLSKPIASGSFCKLVDSCYLGEGGDYKLCAYTTDNREIEMGAFTLSRDPLTIQLSKGSGVWEFHWKKPGYYASVRNLDIYLDGVKKTTKTDLSDTLYYVNFAIGKTGVLEIKPYSSDLYPNKTVPSAPSSATMSFTMGTSFGADYSVMLPVQVAAGEFLFQENLTSIGRYSTSTFTKKSSVSYPYFYGNSSNITTSVSGKTLYGKIGDVYTAIRLNDGNVLSRRSLTPFMGTVYSACPVSDAVSILVTNSTSGVTLLEAATGTQLAKVSGSNVKGLAISASGQYSLIKSDQVRLYQYQNSSLTVVGSWSAPVNGTYYGFDPADARQFIAWENETFKVLSCEDASPVRSFSLTGSTFLSVDTYSDELLIADDQNLKVCSYSSGAVLYTIPYMILPSQKLTPGFFILVNGFIVSKTGLYYKFR